MPNKGVKLPAEVFSAVELDRFFATFNKTTVTGFRNRCIFLLTLRAQLRCREVLSLRVCDVDTNTCTVVVKHGKGGKRRVVGIDQETARELNNWIATRKCDSNPILFPSHRGKELDTSYIRKLVKSHSIRAGITKRMHTHGFRHTGACKLAEAGIDIRIISKQLGHSSTSTTSRYIDHLRPEQVVSAVSAIQW